MTEQEANKLIATKLMGWKKKPCFPGSKTYYWLNSDDQYMFSLKDDYDEEEFNPFHDSNHARMVKDHIGYTAPHIYAPRLAKRLNLPPKLEDWTWVDAFSYHNAPDDVCIWAIVDVLKEMEK